MSLQTTLSDSINAVLQGAAVLGIVPNFALNPTLLSGQVKTGTAADQSDTLYVAQNTLASGANEDLDLFAGLGTNPVGATITMARVRILIIQINGNGASPSVFTESDYLTIGGDGTSNAWVSPFNANTDKVKLYSGTSNNPGLFKLVELGATGYVVGSTNKLLKITNAGASNVQYTKIIIGASV